MLLGRILNVMPDYDAIAYGHLSKAVKLDPKLVDAWNQLGELYWKKGDINNAKNCFTGALTHASTELFILGKSLAGSPISKVYFFPN
ncbi:hypothetical protein DPMN_174072 [Dreissena polymorpha]|uniref:Tetratricopeptide repeat protein n=1 Tax=Dreissena polymorpha TaxID=45954 RepID=A0A9D4II91_DREPO|nr:hypothetical protein DPMN_174072 [Dreissena polymorpha]